MRFLFMLWVCVLACACRYLPLDKPVSQQNIPVPPTHKITATPTDKLGSDDFYVGQTHVNPNGKTYDLRSKELITGKLVDFHANAQKRFEISMVSGLRNGEATWWDSAGRKTHQRFYRAGLLHGSWIEFYDNGNRKQEQVYQNGKETLRWGWWPSGTKRFEIEFVDGVEKSRSLWDQEGKPVMKHKSPPQAREHDRAKTKTKPPQ